MASNFHEVCLQRSETVDSCHKNKIEEMSLKSTEKIRTLSLSQNYLCFLLKKFYLEGLFPVDTRAMLNVHKTFTSRPEHRMNVSSMFNLERVSCGLLYIYNTGI